MIEKKQKGDKTICKLESEEKSLEIEISSGAQSLGFIDSNDFDFSKILKGDDKKVRLNQVGLRLVGDADLTNIGENDFSIVFFEDAELYAVSPWTDEPELIFKVE